MEIAAIDIVALVTATSPIIIAVIDSGKNKDSAGSPKEPNQKAIHVIALYLLIYAIAGLLTSSLLTISTITGQPSSWGSVNVIWATAYLSMAIIMYTNFFKK